MGRGTFRTDLFHRIADWRVELPPLRDRLGHNPNLAAHFLEEESRGREIRIGGISRGAIERLVGSDWPGNFRQLQREMARAALFLEPGELLQSSHLEKNLRGTAPSSGEGGLREAVEACERREISRALGRTDGNHSAAARELGIGRSTLYRKMEELGVGDS